MQPTLEDKKDAGEDEKETKAKTKIGRLVYDKPSDKSAYVDEADDEDKVEETHELRKRFVLTIGVKAGRGHNDNFDELRILSPFVRRVFCEAVPYFPQVTYAKTHVAMPKPYEPLYHFFAAIKQVAMETTPGDDEDLEEWQIFEDWYDQNLKPNFDRIRAIIAQGNIRFQDLWAIFMPGSILFSLDKLDQPQLYVLIAGTLERSWQPLTDRQKEAFAIEFWWVLWDRTSQTFTRNYRMEQIIEYTGTKVRSHTQPHIIEYPILISGISADHNVASLSVQSSQRRNHSWR